MSEIRKIYTDVEMAHRIWDIETVKNIMSLRSFYVYNEWRRKELDELWVQEPENRKTASLGGNWGYYVGMDHIASHYVVDHHARRQAELEANCAALGISPEQANLGFGALYAQPVATPLVQLAGDGKTARGLWYSIGCDSITLPDGSLKAYWVNSKVAADFIREADGWKVWHLIEALDLFCEAGTAYAQQPVFLTAEEDLDRVRFGTPTIPMLTHDVTFNWEDDYPTFPRPYHTYRDCESYGPLGHPNAKEVRK